MQCPQCGGAIEPADQFCGLCGRPLGSALKAAQAPQAGAPTPQAGAPTPQAPAGMGLPPLAHGADAAEAGPRGPVGPGWPPTSMPTAPVPQTPATPPRSPLVFVTVLAALAAVIAVVAAAIVISGRDDPEDAGIRSTETAASDEDSAATSIAPTTTTERSTTTVSTTSPTTTTAAFVAVPALAGLGADAVRAQLEAVGLVLDLQGDAAGQVTLAQVDGAPISAGAEVAAGTVITVTFAVPAPVPTTPALPVGTSDTGQGLICAVMADGRTPELLTAVEQSAIARVAELVDSLAVGDYERARALFGGTVSVASLQAGYADFDASTLLFTRFEVTADATLVSFVSFAQEKGFTRTSTYPLRWRVLTADSTVRLASWPGRPSFEPIGAPLTNVEVLTQNPGWVGQLCQAG